MFIEVPAFVYNKIEREDKGNDTKNVLINLDEIIAVVPSMNEEGTSIIITNNNAFSQLDIAEDYESLKNRILYGYNL